MQTDQRKTQPIEFVTVVRDDDSKLKQSTNNNRDKKEPRTANFTRFRDFPCDEGFISQLTVMGIRDDDDDHTMPSVLQPSLTCTYDSDDDNDDNATFDLISHMISDDELSINSITVTENQSTAEYLTSAAKSIRRKCLERNRKLNHSISCETPRTTSVPLRSSRLNVMKNRLRSLEVHHADRKYVPSKRSTVQSFHADASIDMKDPPQCASDPPILQYKKALVKKSITEYAGEIISINLIFALLYLVFVLFRDVLAKIIQDVQNTNDSFAIL